MRQYLRAAAYAFLVSLTGCAYSVHEVYIGSMDPDVRYGKHGKWIQAESKEFVILGFEFGSDYVNRAYKDLEERCAGRLAQVTTEHQTAYLFLSYNQIVVLKGLCLS